MSFSQFNSSLYIFILALYKNLDLQKFYLPLECHFILLSVSFYK